MLLGLFSFSSFAMRSHLPTKRPCGMSLRTFPEGQEACHPSDGKVDMLRLAQRSGSEEQAKTDAKPQPKTAGDVSELCWLALADFIFKFTIINKPIALFRKQVIKQNMMQSYLVLCNAENRVYVAVVKAHKSPCQIAG